MPAPSPWSATRRAPSTCSLAFAILLAARFALGSLAGGGLMVLWAERGWGSVRRIPGESRYEDTIA